VPAILRTDEALDVAVKRGRGIGPTSEGTEASYKDEMFMKFVIGYEGLAGGTGLLTLLQI
jgi:hypothetical protein